jgi:hypothetical protein
MRLLGVGKAQASVFKYVVFQTEAGDWEMN